MDAETVLVLVFMGLVALWYLKSEFKQLKNLVSDARNN